MHWYCDADNVVLGLICYSQQLHLYFDIVFITTDAKAGNKLIQRSGKIKSVQDTDRTRHHFAYRHAGKKEIQLFYHSIMTSL